MYKYLKNKLSLLYHFCIGYRLAIKRLGFNILNDSLTIDQITKQNKSISRFGDGEYTLIWGKSLGFQDYDENLCKRLKEVLTSNRDGLLVCLPVNFNNTNGLTLKAKIFIRAFVSNNYKKIIETTQNGHGDNRIFGSSTFTRFYIDYYNKCDFVIREKINRIKSIWEQKDIYIIEGRFSRCGVGNDIFKNAKSKHRIICPSTNAFSKYDEILGKAQSVIPKSDDVIVLIMLGPTATVLAYDLSLLGYHAIDLGHMDIEYEWFRNGNKKKVQVLGKAVNEKNDNNPINPIVDDTYINEIICTIE